VPIHRPTRLMDADDRGPVLRSDLALRRRTLWFGSVWRPILIADIRQVEKRPAPPQGSNFVISPEEARDYHCRIDDGIFY